MKRGQPRHGFIKGVPARARAAQERLGSHGLLERAEKMAQFGSWQYDLASGRVRGSQGARRIYGLFAEHWTLGEIQGCALPEYRALLDAAMDGLIRERKPYSIQFRIRRPVDGQIRDIHSIAEFDAGQALVFGMIHDLTDRQRVEADLERRIQKRTGQLEAANRELETFSYSVSHDLRAPLRAIDGFSRVLLEDHRDQLDEEGRDSIRRIREAARRMRQLIEDLLNLSRVGRSEIVLEVVDVTALARRILAGLAEADPGTRFGLSIAEDLRARADGRLLRLALENLLGNSWKFGARGASPAIAVGEAVTASGERVFFIKDNGAGFDMAQADSLFKPFQRLHSDADFEGTGIGLAIVQRIIHRHGGRIWAEAEPGRGATFSFTLPA